MLVMGETHPEETVDDVGTVTDVNGLSFARPSHLPVIPFEDENGDPLLQFKDSHYGGLHKIYESDKRPNNETNGTTSNTMPEARIRRSNLLATLDMYKEVIFMSAKKMFQKVPVFFDRIKSKSVDIYVEYFHGKLFVYSTINLPFACRQINTCTGRLNYLSI